MLVIRGVVAAVCLITATSVRAQQVPGGTTVAVPIAADTGTTVEGASAGIVAAEERVVAGRAMGGFIGGLPIGFLGLLLTRADPAGAIGVGSGLVIIGVSWKLGGIEPPQTQTLREHGPAYQRAYSRSYGERLRQRRRNAAILGGVAGTVTGFGLLFLLLSSITT